MSVRRPTSSRTGVGIGPARTISSTEKTALTPGPVAPIPSIQSISDEYRVGAKSSDREAVYVCAGF